jgi:hypothetical protein
MTETDKSDTSDVQSHQAQRRQSHTYSLRWLIALLSSPLILAAIGFLTSSVATVWQNKENAKLERAKFEFGMIQYRFNEHGFTVKPGDKLEVDGLLGPKTYAVLKRVMAEKDSNKATILSVKNSSN